MGRNRSQGKLGGRVGVRGERRKRLRCSLREHQPAECYNNNKAGNGAAAAAAAAAHSRANAKTSRGNVCFWHLQSVSG